MPMLIPRIKTRVYREFLAEYFATFIYVFITCAAHGVYYLKPAGQDRLLLSRHSIFHIGFLVGMGYYIGTAISLTLTGGMLSPPITFALATIGELRWRRVPIYCAAQMLGGLTAAYGIYILYLQAINSYTVGTDTEVGMIKVAKTFVTYPHSIFTKDGCRYVEITIDQIVASAAFMLGYMSVNDRHNHYVANWMKPLLMGFIYMAIHGAYFIQTGCPLNPARDTMPRFMLWSMGWGSEYVWKDCGHWFLAGILGPFTGSLIGLWVYMLFVGIHCRADPSLQAMNLIHQETMDRPLTEEEVVEKKLTEDGNVRVTIKRTAGGQGGRLADRVSTKT